MYEFFLVLIPKYMPFLLEGALVTVQLALVSMAAGIFLGICVALGRLSTIRAVRWPLSIYVEVWRDVPLIVQLLVIYFTLPQIGLSLPAFAAGCLGLSLNIGAYLSEVFRAAIISVDPGQKDGGISIGMSRLLVYRRIILPQAFRVALPTMGGYFISLLKDTALVSYIAVNELLRNGTIIISNTFKSMEVYLMVAIVYFILSFAASVLVTRLEQWLTPGYLRRSSYHRSRLSEAM